MKIDHLNNSEKLALLNQLEQHFGWNPVASVCVEDVKEYFQRDDIQPPSDENIRKACKYVARKADVDIEHLIDWASEIAQELEMQGVSQ